MAVCLSVFPPFLYFVFFLKKEAVLFVLRLLFIIFALKFGLYYGSKRENNTHG